MKNSGLSRGVLVQLARIVVLQTTDFGSFPKYSTDKQRFKWGRSLNGEHLVCCGDFDCPRFHGFNSYFLLIHNDNVSKYTKCSLSLDELKNNIKIFEEKYGNYYKKELKTYITLDELKEI